MMNVYGPSECTTLSVMNPDILDPSTATRIGKGAGVVTWVVDPTDHNILVPIGAVGELLLEGPLPADTAFLPARLANADAVLAMYHDQGLPVLKYSGFESAVNLTLGLPYPRVAVDHGTALELAGSGRADPSSLFAAIEQCAALGRNRRHVA